MTAVGVISWYMVIYHISDDICVKCILQSLSKGAKCSSMVRVFVHGAMGHWIDPSWDGPIELFLIPASIQ